MRIRGTELGSTHATRKGGAGANATCREESC
jgi:hypothetical protein